MASLIDITASNVTSFIPSGQDIAFTHSVFAQCFLPLRKLRGNAKSYEVKHGNASLAIDAGRLLDPKTDHLVVQNVPYGSAARIVLSHIHNHIIRSGSLDEAIHIPMGDSLREFFRDYRLKYSGKNGKQITEQVHNIATARMTLGIWNTTEATQVDLPKLAKRIDFWMERDERQRSLWQPHMTINPEYARAIRERAVPLDMRALVGLYEKPRAMDVFTWLSYRLPRIRHAKGVFIPFYGEHGLQSVFGNTINDKSMFKIQFTKTLQEVAQWYPEARLTIEDRGLRLYPSPSPIPAESSLSRQPSLFFPAA